MGVGWGTEGSQRLRAHPDLLWTPELMPEPRAHVPALACPQPSLKPRRLSQHQKERVPSPRGSPRTTAPPSRALPSSHFQSPRVLPTWVPASPSLSPLRSQPHSAPVAAEQVSLPWVFPVCRDQPSPRVAVMPPMTGPRGAGRACWILGCGLDRWEAAPPA